MGIQCFHIPSSSSSVVVVVVVVVVVLSESAGFVGVANNEVECISFVSSPSYTYHLQNYHCHHLVQVASLWVKPRGKHSNVITWDVMYLGNTTFLCWRFISCVTTSCWTFLTSVECVCGVYSHQHVIT